MARTCGKELSLAAAPLAATCTSALAQTRTTFATIDGSDVRIVMARVASVGTVAFHFNVMPKNGLRVGGAQGIKLADVSAPGWRCDPPLPRTVYAGAEFFDGAPEIVLTAAPTANADEAVVVLAYELCRAQACYSRDTSIALTQR